MPAETSFTSSAPHEPHPLESSFFSHLSSLDENELEFNSSPYFKMETYFPQEEVRKPNSSFLSSTHSVRKNPSLQSILKMIILAPSFKSHESILRLIERASSFKNPIPHSSQEDFINLKRFLLHNMHCSPILREALLKMKEIEPRILPPPHPSMEGTSFSSKDSSSASTYPSEDSFKPSILKSPSSDHPETSSRKVNLPNFITPNKVSFKEDDSTRSE